MNENLPATVTDDRVALALEKAAVMGDLAQLEPMERLWYYHGVCRSVGLNPLTKPFSYIKLNGQLQLYATKGATDQVRTLRAISITGAERDTSDPLYATWVVTGTDRHGRTDMDIGSVSIAKLAGEAKANAIMKALTKAKRRLTLSLAGLGNVLDESELEAAGAEQVADAMPDYSAMSPAQRMLVQRAEAAVDAPQQPEPADLASQATEQPSEAPGAATEATKDADHEPGTCKPMCKACSAKLAATATEVCGDDGGMLGTCQRMPGHTGKHQNNGRDTWPQERKAK